MLILKLATRNLWRQASRNALSMVSIVFGVFVIVIGAGMAGGLDENAIMGQIDSATGHVQALPKDYPETGFRHPVDGAFALPDDKRTWLDENTVAWTPRLIAAPRAIHGRDSMRVRMHGIAAGDEAVFPRDTWVMEKGAMPSKPGEVVLASSPAQLLQIEVGDLVTLENRTVDGAMNAMRFTVSGVVNTGNPFLDNIAVFLDIADADALLGAEGRVTHVSSRLGHRDQAAAFADELRAQLPDSDVTTWKEEVAGLLEAGEMRRSMFGVLGFAILLMAATGIANTVLMAAYERVREIGTLRSMGLRRSGILAMFALEGLWMGLIGGLIGVAAGGAMCRYYSTNPIDMSSLIEGKSDAMTNMPVAANLYFEYSPTTLVVALVVSVIVAVLASIYPALSASKISPSEAVRPT